MITNDMLLTGVSLAVAALLGGMIVYCSHGMKYERLYDLIVIATSKEWIPYTSYQRVQKEYEDLEEDYEALEEEIKKWQTSTDALECQCKALQAKIYCLEAELYEKNIPNNNERR